MNSFIHGSFFQSRHAQCDNYVYSTVASSIHLDVITGTVVVYYNDGSLYRYTHVSRRAIIKFIIDDARSMDKFINNVLKRDTVKCEHVAPAFAV